MTIDFFDSIVINMDARNIEGTKKFDDHIKGYVLKDIFDGLGENEICKKYSLTSEDFSKLRLEILSDVKEKSSSAEITSYAIRFFRNLLKTREFSAKTKEFGISDISSQFLNLVVNGKMRPTYGIIFKLRRFIAPSMWYYKETEDLPKPIPFTSHYEEEFDEYNLESMNELAQRKTLGHIYFDILKEYRVMARFCALHNSSISEAANFVTMRHHKNGSLRYSARPTIVFVSKFREELNPDFWYIFPDEVSPEILSRLKSDAQNMVSSLRRL